MLRQSVVLCIWMILYFGRGTTSFAFSRANQFTIHRKSFFSRGGEVTRLLALSNGEDPGQPSRGTGRTGWNHNLPSDWKPNGEGKPSQKSRVPSQDKESSEPRTGWLHNTKPKAAAKIATGQSGEASLAKLRLEQAKMEQQRNHRIVAPPEFHACGNGRQIVVTDHRVSVPLYQQGSADRIDLAFTVTEVVKDESTLSYFQSLQRMNPQERAQSYVQWASMENADDCILYLQGGPGFGAPTPVSGISMATEGSWAGKALNHFSRIVLMDQRGTGRSTPITKQSLEKKFPDLFCLEDEAAGELTEVASRRPFDFQKFQSALLTATDYMCQFRADSIVRDAEFVRESLMVLSEPGSPSVGPRPWGAALGQSFGGFCMMTYLSLIDHPPRICLLTGGIAPMQRPAKDAYERLWQRVKHRSLQYYEMYPGDIPLVKKIVKHLLNDPPSLPSGGTLTARRFLQLGLSLGGSPSSFASMHSLLNSAYLLPDETEFTRAFLKQIDSVQSFDDHPIYFLMHESIYGDGEKYSPTAWVAHQAYEDLIKTPSEFDYRLTCTLDSDDRPTLFFGEMVFPWMAEDYAECGGFGLTALANALANKKDWKALYDADHMRQVLGDGGSSRAAAAVYYDDMYVDFDCSMSLTKRGGPLEKCKVYVTNDYQHSGLRDDGAKIFAKLYGMATGSIRTPS